MSGFFLLALCGSSITALAESATLSQVVVDISPGETLKLPRVSGDDARVRIDGKLDEAIWAQLPAYDEFVVVEPDTLAQVPYATRVRIFYTDLGLYFGVELDQPRTEMRLGVQWSQRVVAQMALIEHQRRLGMIMGGELVAKGDRMLGGE